MSFCPAHTATHCLMANVWSVTVWYALYTVPKALRVPAIGARVSAAQAGDGGTRTLVQKMLFTASPCRPMRRARVASESAGAIQHKARRRPGTGAAESCHRIGPVRARPHGAEAWSGQGTHSVEHSGLGCLFLQARRWPLRPALFIAGLKTHPSPRRPSSSNSSRNCSHSERSASPSAAVPAGARGRGAAARR